jgi:twin arginine-targeting protein translocase TatB
MFDVGFSEMLVIGIVALVVIGPERLPRVARTLGVLFGRMQRYVSQVKADINREMEAADLGKVKSEFEKRRALVQDRHRVAGRGRRARDPRGAGVDRPRAPDRGEGCRLGASPGGDAGAVAPARAGHRRAAAAVHARQAVLTPGAAPWTRPRKPSSRT